MGKVATSPLPYWGAPPLQSGGQNQKWPTSGQSGYLTRAVSGIRTASERGAKSEVAHTWAKWLPHPYRIGDPHRFRAGGKIRSGPQVGKVATSPLPYGGAPPLQSGGQNQKWPTSGQIGYLTPAVSGSPTASQRGAKSEVAHKWANWLPHPCRIGDPHRFTAGGKIRSGPQVGKLATSPLPYRGSPPLQSGGQNQKWPTSGQIGYLTPAVLGSPTAAERGAKSKVAHKWANWLPHPCRIGEPHRFRAGGESEVAHKWANWLPHPCRIGDPHRCRAGGKIRSGPQVGEMATSPLPYRGSPPLQSGGQNQKWPTSGQIGYLTPAVSGSPTASERGAKSEVAHKWANWLPHPCRIGEPHRCRAGGKIRSGPQVGKLATSPLPYRGAPPLQSGGQNQKWPTSGQIGYLTPAVSGIPTAAERGAKSEVAHKWAKWLPHPCRIGDPHRCRAGGKIRSGPQVGNWLPHPCRIGEPHRFRAGGKIRSGPQVGEMATSPLPYRGSPPLQSGGQNQKWPTSGQIGYLTPAVSGIPTAAERGAKSEVAHKWANWLPHPCRIGDPHRFRAGGKIRSGPQVGEMATSPLPYRGSPPLQSGGQNQKWPTSGQIGYLTPAVSGSPTASERGAKSEVAHKWAKWRFKAGGKIRSGPQVGEMATSPLPYWGAPPLQSGGQNQKWPTSGQIGYLTPAVSGIPTAAERGAKSEVAHKWAKWLPHPCRIGDPHRFRAGGKIRSGPQVGKVATSPLPYRGSPPLQSGGQNQKWPTSGQNGYLTPAVSGSPTAAERGAKSEVAHKWANWLPHPCRIGDPHRFRAGGKIRSGPQVGKLATSPLPYRGAPPLQSGGQNQKWPTSGQIGYLTPAVSGIPTASERGAKSEVAHKWANWLPHPCRIGEPHRCRAGGKIRSGPQVGKLATSPLPYRGSPPLQSGGQNQKWPTSGKWLPHPCRIGEPHRCRAGGKIRSGPQVGKMATSPLPYRGSPPLQSGGQNQKWPTSGQIGYLTPAVSGIPTASERGAKSEVAHKWANWLPHPCRIGDPHRFRAGGKIRSGPQVGKLATSPLPYRGSPPLQSGGQNQKWPTSGRNGYLTPAVSGIPTASERGAKSEVAHKWANWLPHPCRIGDPHRFRAGGKIRSGPQVGKLATSPLPYRGSPPLQSGGQNQKWPTSGRNGYLTPAVSGIPTASERGAKSEVAHKWAKWLPHPCRIGDPHRFRAGGKIRSGPQVGKVATSPLPYRGSPPLQSGGQNQKWPTSGRNGYLTPAVSGIPTASERGAKSEVAHKWAKWLPHPCRIGEPHRFRAGGKIRSGPQVGEMATSPLPYRGSPPLQSGGQNQKWPTSGQSGYLTPAVSGIPTASERGAKSEVAHKWAKWLPHPCRTAAERGAKSEVAHKWANGYLTPAVSGIPTASKRGAKSEVAHKWAKWLPHPCRIGDPHRFRAGGKIRSGPQVGKLATSPLPYRGSPPLQSGGQNQKWPTSGRNGYLTPAVSGIPTASERGAKSEVAHKWAKWLPHPCRIGDPHRFRAGGKIRSGPQVGKVATSPLPYRGSPPLQSGGQNQKWPTSGQIGYLTPAVSGIPTASERGAKSEVAHKWANWLPHPCRIGDPHRFRAGGKIRSGPQVGEMATSPLPYRGSPPLQSGGQNQKWPTSGQNGYLTPAVSGIPTASERGAKSEVAHKWANWLPHPCRIGDPHRFRAGGKIRSGPQVGKWLPHPCRIGEPHRFRAGGKIRSGPQVGKLATSPLPYRGAPPLQSGGQNQKWPTSGQSGYLTPAVSGIPTASERGAKSEVAHKWAKWLPHPCRIGDPHRFRAGGKIRSGPQVGKWLPHPCRIGEPHRFRAGGKIRSGPQVGEMATSPLPYRGSPPLQSGGQNQKWPTSGQIGYLTPAVSGIPTASERGAKSEVAHKWANWLPHPCRIGDPHRFRAGGKIRSGPQVGEMATSPLPYRGSPPLQSGGQNQKWPTSGQIGYLTPAVSGSPTASERGAKSEVAHKWAKWLPHPCRIGEPHRFRAGGKIRSGPQVGKVATSPLPYRGSPPLQSGGQNQKWPTSGQSGYLTPAVSGIPTASERGAKSEVAHKWANWLPHPCRIGEPHRCRAGGKIRSGPQVGKLATSPLPYRGAPPLQSGGQNQKWPTSGRNGYLTPAVSGSPTAAERGAKSEVAHKWANWLPHPCRIGEPHRFRAGGKIRSGPQVGKLATSPLPYRGAPPLQSGGQNQKWPTSGRNGYLTPAVSGIPTASERGAKSEVAHKWANGYLTPAVSGSPTAAERGAKSEVAHKWAKWLPHPCRIGDPHRFRAGGKIRSGPQVGKLATSPLPYRGSPPLQSGGQNQKWPTSGQIGYLTPAVSGSPTASERGAKSEVAHKWANWLPHPCRIGDPHRFRAGGKIRSGPQVGKWLPHPCRIGEPHRFRAGGKIRSGPQVGKMATSPLPYRGSPPLQSGGQNQKWPTSGQMATSPLPYRGAPPLQSGGQNQKWPTSGQIGYLTPAVSGIPTASERGAKSEVAHKWAKWLPHPCRIGEPHRFRAGGKIRSGPQVGKLATSPLPYRGAPPLQSGGQNQKWPTSGQIGYLTPAVSGSPTASERGAKSEVAHKWANWLPHPCRIGEPHRFRAGGKIRSGPQVGKLATSPLPYRGAPPLQSGGQNQKWPTSGQIGYLTPAVSGSPTAAERGAKSEVAHKWANWLPHPCRIGEPHRCRAGGKIRSGPQVGKLATSPLPYRGAPPLQSGGQNQKWPTSGQMATSPLPYRGAPPLQSGGQNQKWPTSGQIGYLTPAVSGSPTASERGAKSEVAHKWANWLPHPCRIGEPHRFRAGGKIRSGPQVGKLATSPLPYRGAPPLQSGGQNQKWPTSGRNGYLTPAVSGSPTASERGAKSEVAHKWANWLPHPCRIGEPHRFRAGGKIRSGPQVGKLATSPLPYRGAPPLQSGGQNQKWPTSGQIGYLTPAVSGSPTASERGAKSEVAHKWANWLPHPCRIGEPHRCRAGGKIRSGPQVGKLATSPLPYRGAPPLQSGGQNQKWPTSGQIGYLTPAVSGSPTASERGAKSEVAHKWANWLPHPCRIGEPHRFRAGGKIRSGPQVGKLATSPLPYRGAPPLQSGGQNQKWPTSGQMATSPLPYRGAPPLQSGGQNQKWPTSGQIGYLTPAVSGSPTASERGAKSEVAHKWANWLPHPCRIGEPHRFRAGGKIRSGPQVGKLATSPLPYRGAPPLQSGGQNQKWPTSGQIGYLTPAVSGSPTASERGAKSEVAHKWANWLPHPCRIGEPHRFRAGGKIRSGPQVGKLATSPLPYRGAPPLQSGGQNQKWPTSGQIGYLTPAVSGSPTASERGAKSEVAHKWANGYLTPAVSGSPTAAERGAKSEVAHKWANWLPHPCRIGEPHRFRAGGKIRSGPQVGKLATSPLPYRGAPPLQSGGQNQKWPTSGQSGYLTPAVSGAPPLQSGGQNQKWPTSGQIGYLTPAVSGSPTASERGAKSEVAHKWANWLPHPCRIGEPHRCRAGGKIRSGPQVGKLATSPLPYRGAPPLQSGGQNQKWPTSGQIGYLTPAVSGSPTAAERGAKSEVAHKWANWLPHPCRIGEPHRCRAGGKIRSGPQVGKLATSPLPYRGAPPLQSGGQNQKWPTSGQIGYLTPAVSGSPTASERGAKSEVAHKWANWLPHPCRIGEPHRFRAGGKIRSGPQVGKLATSPLPYRGAPPLQSGGQNQKWPTSGQIGYLTPAVSGSPTASERGAKSEVAHKWAKWLPHPCRIGEPHRCRAGGKIRSGPQVGKWLPHPCRIGEPHRFRAGGKIRSGPQVGKLATSPLPYRGAPPLQSGGQNQKWPTSGQMATSPLPYRGAPPLQSGGQNQKWPTSGRNGYLTPAVSGSPTAAERGAKSEVAHKWANWLPHPCRIGEPHRCRAGGKIRSGPQVGKLATSPLPYRGAPPLQSGGQNQKWPTSGQIGYLTPAVSGSPTASERGAKSEVAHKWANWLPHPCRIGEPHRFRAGGKIRSGPQVGKLATSPLPYRGAPPLQSGGQNQKWPTSGRNGYLTPAVSGSPTAAERGAKSEVAHKWANWLPHPCRIGEPHRFRAGGKIRSGPQVGEMATSPLPYRGAPPLQSGGQNQKWPTSGQIGYLTPAVSGSPTASERGAKSEVAHKWANWLPHPCRIGEPHRFRAGGKIRSGPQVGKLATSPLPYRGAPPLQSGGQNQKWPTSGRNGYLTPAVSGSPTAAERGAKSEVAHKWANWLPHPCRIGEPHRCRAGGKIRSGPQVGKLATSPLPYRGAPPLQSGGQNQKWPTSGQIGYLTPAVSGSPTAAERGAKSEVAHKWAKWLPHPCRIGEPHRCRAGGKIRSGPQVGKLATSPLPYRGAPPLQSGGQNQKWPTSGQIGYLTPAVSGSPTASERGAKSEVAHKWANGYLTPAVSGIPTASERGAKSEVAHKWANWLPHPCRIGEPHRFRAGGKIRSGPQVGEIGYLTPAVSGSPTASERGAKSEVAHKWANWLPHPCRIGEPHRFRAGGKIRSGPQVGKLATSPLPYRGAPPLQSGGQNQKWPTSGQMATSPLPYRGAPPLQSGGQNQKWPTSGQIGYLTPAVSGSPTASERGAKSEVAHKWANWLPHPCRIGEPHRCRAGGKIRSGPQVGKLATSPLPYRGAPPLQSGGQNQKWPTSGQIGYLTPAVSGSPTASERGAKSEVAHKWANWLPHPCRIGEPHRFRAGGKIRSGPQVGKLATSPLPYRGAPPLQSGGQNQKWPTSGQIGYLTPAVSGSPTASERGAKSEVAHKWANWLPHPCRIGEPHRCRAGGKIRSGPQVGKLATSPLPYRGAPPLQSGGQNQKWPTSGQIGYLTPAVSGSPTASERGAKSEVAHKWANWLPHPCRIGEPHRFRAGGKIRSGPQVGKLATSPLPYRGAPPLQSGGQNQKWPTSGQIGYLTPAVSGSPTAAERGAKSEVAHKWAKWLPHPCRIGEPHRFRAGGKIRSGPQVGKLATSPLPYRGAPPLQSGGQNQKWPTSGQIGYLTPAVSGSPTASERGAKSEVAHKWANWLPHPCRIGEPHRFRAGGKIRSGPQVGKLATSPLPYRGAPPLQSGGQNQKWPTSGQIGYLTPAVSGSPTAAERGAKSEVAHKWANWLPHPCRIGEPHRCRAGGKIRSGPQVGKMATSPLPYRGAPPLQSGGQNQKWPTSGQIGYLTPAVSGSPTAAERGAKSEVAHKWANWLPHPCRIGEPHRFRAGGKIRSGPQVGKLATSPLPYRGAPPLQSGGQNQKWPTSGQIGYLTPAVSGSPTASERGAKSEVAHKWANWLPHPCRIGEPHRCRAGGKIRSGPQVGKLATSPLPYRGAPPLQSGGQNQKWPTSGQIGYLTPAVSGSPTASERGAKSEVAHKWANWLPHPCRIGEPHRSERGAKSEVAHKWANWLPHPCRIGEPHRSERGAKSEVAHKWANWLPHPCRIGEPHRFRAGGKIRSGPQVGKLATSPLPYRGAPPLQSGGQNQKWPTSGQIGYLTPAVSGSPTASERGAKSEVAHKWANWLPHPCRIGEPHRCRAGGKIRSGPQVGKLATSPLPYRGAPPLRAGGKIRSGPQVGEMATSPLPYRGSPPLRAGGKIRSGPQVGKLATSPLPYRGAPPLQSGGQNQKWPTSGQIGYLTPAVSGSPTASERGAKSEVAHKWANWLPHPCRIGDPHRSERGAKSEVAHKWANWLPHPCRIGDPHRSERGAKSEVAHKWANWLPHPCRIGEPHRFRAGGKIRSGPQVGKLATSPLPYRGAPPLQSGGQNQKWPTSGQIGYLTPAVSGIPTASERGAKSEVAHKWANWLPHPCRIGEPHRCRAGGKIRSGPQVGKWLPHPCRIGDPHRCRAGGKIRSGPQVGEMATSPLPYRGAPPLQSGGQNQKWPTSGQIGYLTPAVSGIPTASERGAKSEVAHKWANWLPHPCRIGEPHRFRAGGKIRSGPQVGKLATSPLPYRGAPPLQSGGQNQKWPTSGQIGYLTPAVSGSPTASERGAKSEVAHKWANWLPHPCRIGDPHRCRAGGKIRSGPQVGEMATSPLPYRGAPPLQSGGQNQKWPTSGRNGYLTPAVSGSPTASERGAKSEVAHKWANWLPHPCRIGEPHRFRAGGKIRSGPQVGKLATSPLPYRGAPPLQSGGQNQKWPTSGQIGYLTPAVSGSPTASERGAKSEVAHKWANWLPHPCRIGEPHRFRAGGKIRSPQVGKLATSLCRIEEPHRFTAGGKIRSGPQVGKLATSPLPYRGSPPLQSGGQNQKWPTSGQIGYLTPAVSGITTASQRGAKSANCRITLGPHTQLFGGARHHGFQLGGGGGVGGPRCPSRRQSPRAAKKTLKRTPVFEFGSKGV